jgi:hypothetical protein
MAQNRNFTWTCPACRRRVPQRVQVCHCGFTRTRAEAAATAQEVAPAAAGRLSWQFWSWMALLGLAFLLAVVQMLRPYQRPEIPALLGYVDPPRPTPPPPSASPTPADASPR